MSGWKKRTKLWLALGGLALFAGFALGDAFNVRNMGDHYQNASTGARVTSAGHATVAEQDPAMDANLTFSSIIGPTAIAALGADSSAILDTHRMRLGMLLIKAVGAGGAAATDNRLAVQIRTHLSGSSDTSSVFSVFLYGSTPVFTAAAAFDSVGTGHLRAGSTSVLWSEELSVNVDGARNAAQTGGGANDFRSPNGIAIPLQSIFGRDLYSPHTSIRIRNLMGPTVTVTAHLIGTPL